MSPSGQNRPLPALFGWRSRLAIIVAGLLLLSWGGPAASAFWGSISSGPGAAKADALAQGARPAAGISGANVTVSWTASTTAAGHPVTGYSIARYSSATAGTRIPATGACAGTVPGLSCVEAGVPAGTWYYTVTPTLSLWQGTESQRSTATTPVTDTTPPLAPVVTAPGSVNQGNVSSVPVSGTAEANSTVVLTITGGGAQAVTQTITTDAAGNWTAVPVNLGAFSPGTITFSAKATDAAGNTGPAGTATATKDVSSPTITGVQLINGGGTSGSGVMASGDKVALTFSEPLSAGSICTAWTSNTAQTLTGNGVVTVSVNAANELTVTSNGCSVGTVGLGAIYNSGPLSFVGNGNNASSLAWTPTATSGTLTITLGGVNTSGDKVISSTSVFPSYSPAPGLKDLAGNAVAPGSVPGTPSRF